MKKLIIIGHEPLTFRLREIFLLDELLERGVNMEYWDISQLRFPGIDIPEVEKASFIKKISTKAIFIKELATADISNAMFIVEVMMSWKFRYIFRLIQRYKCYCIRIDLYGNTMLPSTKTKRLQKIFSDKFLLRIPEKLLEWSYQKLFLSNFYKKRLSSSKLSNPDLSINHPDYELFSSIDNRPIIEGEYILFIDTYYPLHPDLKYMYGVCNEREVGHYRNLMKRFFDYLEIKFSKKVIIALHPKAKYIGNEFGNRAQIKGKTCNLVKFADFIITHESNSLSFISLANKPFAFVYPDSYNQISILKSYLIQLANYCNKKAYNLDTCDWNDIEFSCLDSDFRQNYINSFLINSTDPMLKNIDTIISLLKCYEK